LGNHNLQTCYQTKAGDPLNGGIKAGLRSPFEHGDAMLLIQSLE
jgi:hypothetical protein